ncbi:GGDEF domain-containing protein [uncultured Selenomonas sp.]|uniref:GGDEF domain-containing protein n=1 Tax=uncultured Selenomonas sp. TaxID=159275 RepID=UPI0025D22D5D|nr:GGDEF domain-containing protein [uncultured Selenomonas sp.]
MAQRIRQSMSAHLRLGRLDRTLLTAVPVSVALLFFAMLAMIACYQMDGSPMWLVRMVFAISIVTILLLYGFFHILQSWRRSDAYLYTDPLCPCGSRTAMQELLRRLEPRRDIDVTILYADLNHFKYVNDTFGHEAGDQLLVLFARTLGRVFDGSHAMTARVGGDEFVVILKDVDEKEILEAWQQVELDLQEESRRLPFRYWITSAHGCATRPKGDLRPLEDIVRAADHAMYECKEAMKRNAQVQSTTARRSA